MTLQPISRDGKTIAAATLTRFFLCDELNLRPIGDPERTFAIFMCAYARDVQAGELPGPYSDEDARRYARAALLPLELIERPDVDLDRVAAAMQVPIDELLAARADAERA